MFDFACEWGKRWNWFRGWYVFRRFHNRPCWMLYLPEPMIIWMIFASKVVWGLLHPWRDGFFWLFLHFQNQRSDDAFLSWVLLDETLNSRAIHFPAFSFFLLSFSLCFPFLAKPHIPLPFKNISLPFRPARVSILHSLPFSYKTNTSASSTPPYIMFARRPYNRNPSSLF